MRGSQTSAWVLLAFWAGTFGSPAVALRGQEVEDGCLTCHADSAFFQGFQDSSRYVVDETHFSGSVHEAFASSCDVCHKNSQFPHTQAAEVTCSPCHSDLEARYGESLHGHGLARGNPRAPDCAACHGGHRILPRLDPGSSIRRDSIPGLCGGCHGMEGLLTDQLVKLPKSFQQYAGSVHGRSVLEGGGAGATCTDCHSVHDLKGAQDPESRINPLSVASTCGVCHPAAEADYEESIHGRALRAGITDTPTCVDCHGAHLILASDDPEAPICGARQAQDTCGKCHDDPSIISKYGLQDGVVESYLESYHGWASRTGCEVTASCVDCHTAHRILPVQDPASSVSSENVVATCAQCHDGASPAFATAYNHRTASIAGNPVNRAIRAIYLWAIVIIVGAMIVHNLIIMNFYMLKRRKELAGSQESVRRFSRNEVLQHFSLTLSFVVLLITGFALRYPESWWALGLARMGMDEGLRGDIHRAAGVMLILTSLYHAYYILATRRGRRELAAFLPTRRDWKDLVQNLRYHTFRSREKVEFGRYDYSQKAEYWALVWGTALMALTGLVLWFPTVVVRFLPGIVIPAAQTIHFYEAVLAGLVILVWHFFFVVFHPEEYPMSWTWLTGKMTRKAAQTHHGKWYREVAQEAAELAEGARSAEEARGLEKPGAEKERGASG